MFSFKSDGSINQEAVASATTDKEGNAFVLLDKSTYRVSACGSWIGSTDFS